METTDRLELEVIAKTTESNGVASFVLVDSTGAELPPWEPGAHIDVFISEDLVRQYSLCSDPADRHRWRIGVLNVIDGRGGSRAMHETIEVGDLLWVSMPRNNFAFVDAPSYQFFAGGIGITPLLPMIRAAESAGAEWSLVYGGRNLESMAFREELGSYGNRVMVVPQDTLGFVDLGAVLAERDRSTLVYGCGPAPMLQALEKAMADWPEGALQVERFSPKEIAKSPNVPFLVRFALSDVEATIPADRSILSVAEDLRLPVEFSCREGTCGTCETYIVSGRVEHRDSILTEAERDANESMFICVSRSVAGTPLELEL